VSLIASAFVLIELQVKAFLGVSKLIHFRQRNFELPVASSADPDNGGHAELFGYAKSAVVMNSRM